MYFRLVCALVGTFALSSFAFARTPEAVLGDVVSIVDSRVDELDSLIRVLEDTNVPFLTKWNQLRGRGFVQKEAYVAFQESLQGEDRNMFARVSRAQVEQTMSRSSTIPTTKLRNLIETSIFQIKVLRHQIHSLLVYDEQSAHMNSERDVWSAFLARYLAKEKGITGVDTTPMHCFSKNGRYSPSCRLFFIYARLQVSSILIVDLENVFKEGVRSRFRVSPLLFSLSTLIEREIPSLAGRWRSTIGPRRKRRELVKKVFPDKERRRAEDLMTTLKEDPRFKEQWQKLVPLVEVLREADSPQTILWQRISDKRYKLAAMLESKDPKKVEITGLSMQSGDFLIHDVSFQLLQILQRLNGYLQSILEPDQESEKLASVGDLPPPAFQLEEAFAGARIGSVQTGTETKPDYLETGSGERESGSLSSSLDAVAFVEEPRMAPGTICEVLDEIEDPKDRDEIKEAMLNADAVFHEFRLKKRGPHRGTHVQGEAPSETEEGVETRDLSQYKRLVAPIFDTRKHLTFEDLREIVTGLGPEIAELKPTSGGHEMLRLTGEGIPLVTIGAFHTSGQAKETSPIAPKALNRVRNAFRMAGFQSV